MIPIRKWRHEDGRIREARLTDAQARLFRVTEVVDVPDEPENIVGKPKTAKAPRKSKAVKEKTEKPKGTKTTKPKAVKAPKVANDDIPEID